MSVHRKSRTKAARKSKGQQDGLEVCNNGHFDVPPSSLAPHPDCTKVLDDIPSFAWDNADDLWERLEEEDWMGIVSVKFFNPVTRKLRKSPPGERNVCSYIHTTFDNQEIEVFAPLKCAESVGKVVVKTGSVEKWSDIEQLWSYGLTFREVQHELLKGILQTKMEENARLQFGLLGAAEEIARLREEMVCAEQLQQEMKKNTLLLHDQLEAKELGLQEKDKEIADHKKRAKLLEEKEEEYVRLQEKLDMISSCLFRRIVALAAATAAVGRTNGSRTTAADRAQAQPRGVHDHPRGPRTRRADQGSQELCSLAPAADAARLLAVQGFEQGG